MYPNNYQFDHPFVQDPYTPYYEGSYYDPYDYDRQFGQFFPPMGPPPGGTGFPPQGPPFGQGPGGGGGAQAGAPTSPPPSFVPAQTQQVGALAVDPGSIRRCMFRFTYIWMRGNQQFWFYPIFLGRTSISGYRWNGFRWLFFGVSLRQIQSFTCV